MSFPVFTEAESFLGSVLGGMVIGLAYSLFRILRLPFGGSRWSDAVFDILFSAVAGILIAASVLYFNCGAFRMYILLGLALGAFCYMRTADLLLARLLSSKSNKIRM